MYDNSPSSWLPNMWLSMHIAITKSVHCYNCVYWERGLCPATIRGHCGLWQGDHLCSQGGMMAVDWFLTREVRKQPIPGRTVCLDREVSSDTTRDVMQICSMKLCSQGEQKCKHFWSARGTWHFSDRVMSFNDNKTMTSVIGSSQIWLALLFTTVITTIPTPDWSWGTKSRFLFLNG